MTFDWRVFFDRHNIFYVERGPSTAKGNIYIHCPFCGEADSGHHMGCSENNIKGWGCWKSAGHRGKAPQRLIQALLQVSWSEAAQIAASGARHVPESDTGLLAAVKQALDSTPKHGADRVSLVLPSGLVPCSYQYTPAWDYLRENRNLSRAQIEDLEISYQAGFAFQGMWRYRIVIPVYSEQRDLLTWTARTVAPNVEPKYKTLTPDPEKANGGPVAKLPISDVLMNMESLRKCAGNLVICEGFFDQAKLNYYMDWEYGVATCLFGKVVSESQMDLIAYLRPQYENVFLLLDPDAVFDNLRISVELQALGVIPIFLQGNKDPGDMRKDEVEALMREMDNRGKRKA